MATTKTRVVANGQHEIVLLRPDYQKKNLSAKRFALYKKLGCRVQTSDGKITGNKPVTVNAYIEACRQLGDDKGAADVRWDSNPKRQGGAIIRLLAPAATATGKAA